MLPPKWVRRVVITPIAWVVIVGLVALMPVALLVALVPAPFGSGRQRAARVLWMATVYLALEAIALVVLFGLWIGSGFGFALSGPRFQRAHYVLTGRFLRILYQTAQWALKVRVAVIGTDPDIAAPGRPELVFCRHAGPGDSFLLVHALVNWFNREPRIVLKDTLQWDPVIDVMLNRLPSRFIKLRRNGAAAEDEIGGAGHRARRERRAGPVPGGRQLHAATGGSGRSTGCTGSACTRWPSGPSGCATYWPRSRAARSPRSTPPRTPRSSSSRTPGSTRC